MHYEGKTHDKGVRAFFVNWSGNTTKIVPQKLVSSEKKPKPSPVNIYSMNRDPMIFDIDFFFRVLATTPTSTATSAISTSPVRFKVTNTSWARTI